MTTPRVPFGRTLAALSIAAFAAAPPAAAQPLDLPTLRSADGLPTLAPVVSQVAPAIVAVSAEGGRVPGLPGVLGDPSLRDLFGAPAVRPFGAAPETFAGIVVDAGAGHVLTSRRLLAGGGRLTVTLGDGRTFEARPIGGDALTDLALLRIEAEGLPALPVDGDTLPATGDFVLAIGGPSGTGRAIASGMVGGAGGGALLRTDAEVEPGGALVALDGRLVGVAASSDGATLAVAADAARAAIDRILAEAADRPVQLGVAIRDAGPEEGGDGALVMRVEPGSAAAAAGLVAGDVIVAVDGETVEGAGDLRTLIASKRAGDEVVLERLRGGAPETVRAVLFAAPATRDGAGVDRFGARTPEGSAEEPMQ